MSATERDNKQLHDKWLDTAINYKVEWERELDRRNRLGINALPPLPHPDDIVIDLQTGSVRITGPMTKEEKVKWDRFAENRSKAIEAAAELRAILEAEPDHPEWDELNATIKYVEETFRSVDVIKGQR